MATQVRWSVVAGACSALLGLFLSISCTERATLRREDPATVGSVPQDWSKVIPVDPHEGLYFDRLSGRIFRDRRFVLSHDEVYYLAVFSEGLCGVRRLGGDKYGYIDKTGQVVIPFQYDEAGMFNNGRAVVEAEGGTGIVDQRGRWVVEPGRYAILHGFSEGLCAFTKDTEEPRRWGFLDVDGREVIPSRYRKDSGLLLFNEDRCLVVDEAGDKVYIDRRGRVRAKLPNPEWTGYFFSEGLVRIEEDCAYAESPQLIAGPEDFPTRLRWGRYGYMSRDGRIVIEPRFGTAGDFSEGLAPVSMTEDGYFSELREREHWPEEWSPDSDIPEPPPAWGFINQKGEVVIPMIYEKAGHFSEGLAAVRKEGRWGYIDRQGRMVIGAGFEWAEEFKDGIAVVVLDGKIVYIDKYGQIVLRTENTYSNF